MFHSIKCKYKFIKYRNIYLFLQHFTLGCVLIILYTGQTKIRNSKFLLHSWLHEGEKTKIVGKMLWYKRSKTSWDMPLKENNQLLGGNSNSYNSMPCHVISLTYYTHFWQWGVCLFWYYNKQHSELSVWMVYRNKQYLCSSSKPLIETGNQKTDFCRMHRVPISFNVHKHNCDRALSRKIWATSLQDFSDSNHCLQEHMEFIRHIICLVRPIGCTQF